MPTNALAPPPQVIALISRQDAKAKGLKRYFTGKCCSEGHVATRFVSTRACTVCCKNASAKWKQDNPEIEKACQGAYYAANSERRRNYTKLWCQANLERRKKYTAEHYAANKARILESGRQRRAANKHKVAALAAAKRAEKDQRTPKWLTKQDFADVRSIYAMANELSRAYGFPWHVDHIIPLKGRNVSGLHTPANLQIIPGVTNRKKSNLFHV